MSSTLDELTFYCRKDHPAGALVLFGEPGCGKTWLIDKQLQDELKDTHYIVRVSLFGINSIDELHTAVKKQWLLKLSPLLSKLSSNRVKMEKGKSIFEAVSAIIMALNPQIGTVTDAVTHSLDYLVITPEVEDHITKEKKKVVLVFDDVDRSNLNWPELLGSINDYCENQHFNVIIIANRKNFSENDTASADFIRAAKEKTVACSVINSPDYCSIVHAIIEETAWKTEEYSSFIKDHEQDVTELFADDTVITTEGASAISRSHNLRSLITGLESFYRIYHHMTAVGIENIDEYFTSFLSFYLAEKSGVIRDGQTSYSFTDEDLKALYPRYSPAFLFECVRKWIRYGYWDEKQFSEQISSLTQKQS